MGQEWLALLLTHMHLVVDGKSPTAHGWIEGNYTFVVIEQQGCTSAAKHILDIRQNSYYQTWHV